MTLLPLWDLSGDCIVASQLSYMTFAVTACRYEICLVTVLLLWDLSGDSVVAMGSV